MYDSIIISFSIAKILGLVPIKKVIKNEPDAFSIVMPRFDPKTEPRMIAPISRVINMPNGMANFFFRYQERLVDAIKYSIKKYSYKKCG